MIEITDSTCFKSVHCFQLTKNTIECINRKFKLAVNYPDTNTDLKIKIASAVLFIRNQK